MFNQCFFTRLLYDNLMTMLLTLQMSGWYGDVYGGQGTQKPVSGVQTEEMSTDGNEQRW